MPETLELPLQIPEVKGMTPKQFLASSPDAYQDFLSLDNERKVEVAQGFTSLAKAFPNEHERFRSLKEQVSPKKFKIASA